MCDIPWGSPGERRRRSADEKRQGKKQGQTQEQVEGQRTRYIREQKPEERIGQGKKKSSKGQRSGKRKEENWRQDGRKDKRAKTFEDMVIQLFSNLMEGATMQDWLSLFDFQNTRRHIYYYNDETRCVDQPCCGFLQCSILATFGVASLYQTCSIFKASLNIFANRYRWRCFFRDKPRQQLSICVPSHGRTRVCTHPVAPSLDTWTSSLQRCLTEVFIKSSRTASRDRSFCNKIPLVNFGLEILSKSGLEAVANDKDGGYSLVDPNVPTSIHLQLLMNGQFFETDFMNWDRRCAKASLSYSILCKRVEDLEQEPELARIEKIPVNSWSIDRGTVGDFMQESQAARCSEIQKHPQCSTSCFCRSRSVVRKSTQRAVDTISDSVP